MLLTMPCLISSNADATKSLDVQWVHSYRITFLKYSKASGLDPLISQDFIFKKTTVMPLYKNNHNVYSLISTSIEHWGTTNLTGVIILLVISDS